MQRETKARKVGTVTVLFTDLVGSTEMLDRVGDDAADRMRRRHFRMLRQVARDWGGTEVKSLGDGLMIVFSSAYDAVAYAIAVQSKATQDPDRAQVRVGLHTGEVAWEEDDVFGTPVVVARRLCDSANGGQILASDLVRGLLGTRGGFSFRDIGFLELKGLRTAIPASEILLPDHVDELEHEDEEPTATRRFGQWPAALLGVGVLLLGLWVALPFGRQDGNTSGLQGGNRSSRSLLWARDRSSVGFDGNGDQVMADVVTRGSTLLVGGSDSRSGDRDAIVWLRRGSQSWTEVHLEAPADRTGDQWVTGLTTDEGRLVAVGARGQAGIYDAAAWVSRDGGSSWERADSSDSGYPGTRFMNAVASASSGLVAVGHESLVSDQLSVAFWFSESAAAWTRVDQEPLSGKALSVVAAGRTIVAVGRAESENEGFESDAAVWMSIAGTSWERVGAESLESPGYQVMTSIIRGGPGFIAAGYDTASGSADAAMWTSRDGNEWKRVPRSDELFGGPGIQRIDALGRHAGLYIAAGFDGSENAAEVWVSNDGAVWKRESIDAILGGNREQEIRSLAILSDQVVAVGVDHASGDSDAAVWTGRVRRP